MGSQSWSSNKNSDSKAWVSSPGGQYFMYTVTHCCLESNTIHDSTGRRGLEAPCVEFPGLCCMHFFPWLILICVLPFCKL